MSGLSRLQLANLLKGLASSDFEKILFAIHPPAGLIPGATAPQSDRGLAVLNWAESPTGPGLAALQALLEDLETLPEPPPIPDPADPTPLDLGPNPYQGLRAFEEEDQDRFFGRDQLVEDLLQRFERLYTAPRTPRILPIYGPSGSGKSSLARAGLIPALRKHPLPGKDSPHILTLKPGNHPLEVLATALARLATPGDLSIAKIREFQDELLRSDSKQAFDGLRFITDRLLEHDPKAYLILLVDQFEEIYTLCEDPQERHALICNLRGAASDPSQRVAVILTMRSDFLSATQQHPQFNQLFADPGRLVPVMQPEELEQAIIQPAKLALAKLDRTTRDRVNQWANKSFVQLLVKEAMGQEGALPLLQFLLTQIWEEMRQGIEPIETYNRVGGIGGALASEAKEIYEDLSESDQKIARSIFLRLIKVNDDKTATRRRVPLSELVTKDQDATQIKAIIHQFTRPGVWILITFANEEQIEMVEVAHEALLQNWDDLREWLADQWEILRKRDKIEQAAHEWESHQRDSEYLLQGKTLCNAREFIKSQATNSELTLSKSSDDLIRKSSTYQLKRKIRSFSIFLLIPVIGILIATHFQIIAKANSILNATDCKPDPGIKRLLRYMWHLGYADELRDVNLCNEDLRGIQLPGIIIARPNFERANLAGANFNNSFLSLSNFRGATLASSDFSGDSLLIGSDFSCVDNICATLFNSNLENAILKKANFEGATLDGAIFRGANLTDANLAGSHGLTEEQIESAILCRTQLPDELNHIFGDRDCDNEQ